MVCATVPVPVWNTAVRAVPVTFPAASVTVVAAVTVTVALAAKFAVPLNVKVWLVLSHEQLAPLGHVNVDVPSYAEIAACAVVVFIGVGNVIVNVAFRLTLADDRNGVSRGSAALTGTVPPATPVPVWKVVSNARPRVLPAASTVEEPALTVNTELAA